MARILLLQGIHVYCIQYNYYSQSTICKLEMFGHCTGFSAQFYIQYIGCQQMSSYVTIWGNYVDESPVLQPVELASLLLESIYCHRENAGTPRMVP